MANVIAEMEKRRTTRELPDFNPGTPSWST